MSLYPLHAINLNMLKVQGRSDIFLYLEIIKKIMAIGPICIGIFIGIYWMLITTIATGLFSFFLNSYYTGQKLGYTSFMQLKDILPDFFVALSVAIPVYFLKYLPLSYWYILPLQIFVGTIILIITCRVTKNEEFSELRILMRSIINELKK